MKKIAVLITCYNRVSTTLDCLENLFKQVLPVDYLLEVFLVDDDSPDLTGDIVKAKYPCVNVVKSNGGLFWCKGMRLAWDVAAARWDYDFYLWLNDDVILKENAILGVMNDYEQVRGVIVGTFSTDETESVVSYGATRSLPSGRPEIADAGMNGNLVLVPRDVYLVVGKIYNGYHHQYGDYEYGLQLLKRGMRFYSSSHFCGVCPQQPERYLHLNGQPLMARLKLLFNPKGYSLHDAFLFSVRNRGVFQGLLSVAHVIFKVVFARDVRI